MRFCSILTYGAAALGLSMAAGCGGGGSESAHSGISSEITSGKPSTVVGSSFTVSGKLVARPNAVKAGAWSVTALSAGAPVLNVSNTDCEQSTLQNDVIADTETFSVFLCSGVVAVPAWLGSDTTFRLTFAGSDTKGQTASSFVDFTVAAGKAPAPAVLPEVKIEAAPSRSVKSGDAVQLTAKVVSDSVLPYYYQWSQTAGPSVLLGGADTATVGIIAPTVLGVTELQFQVLVSRTPFQVTPPQEISVATVVVGVAKDE